MLAKYHRQIIRDAGLRKEDRERETDNLELSEFMKFNVIALCNPLKRHVSPNSTSQLR